MGDGAVDGAGDDRRTGDRHPWGGDPQRSPGNAQPGIGRIVEIIRNTPFVVQLFFIVFGLPNLGLKMTAGEAALLAMVVNLGAYSTEIVRAGIQVTPKGQWEAGRVLGLSRTQTFVRVVLPPRCHGFTRRWSASASL